MTPRSERGPHAYGTDVDVDVETLLRRMVAPAAAAVEELAAASGVTKVNEQRHLAPCFRTTLASAVAGTPYREALPRERRLGDRTEWPGVGDVDALVAGPHGSAWIELKCGSGHEALCACAWDTPKMALALGIGRAAHAYLLAAATCAHWDDGIRGSEFFRPYGVDRTMENRARFADWWKHWEKRGDPLPVRLPARYVTERIADEQFQVGRTLYELRLTRVTVDGDDRYDWEPFLPPERRGKQA